MIVDDVARLAVQPVLGPPGPRVLALLVLFLAAALASLFRAIGHGWALIAHPGPQPIPVEVPRRRTPSRSR